MVFKKSLCPCVLDESSLSIGRAKSIVRGHILYIWAITKDDCFAGIQVLFYHQKGPDLSNGSS